MQETDGVAQRLLRLSRPRTCLLTVRLGRGRAEGEGWQRAGAKPAREPSGAACRRARKERDRKGKDKRAHQTSVAWL